MSTDAGRRFVFLLVNTVGRSRRGDAYERWSVCGFDTALWEEQLGENVFFYYLFVCLFMRATATVLKLIPVRTCQYIY